MLLLPRWRQGTWGWLPSAMLRRARWCGNACVGRVQFRKYKEMQQQLQREKELWDEQHAGGARPPPAVGLQRAAFNVGSMFGSVRNAIVAGATGHGRPSMEDAAAAADAAVVPLDTYEAAAKSSLPVCCPRRVSRIIRIIGHLLDVSIARNNAALLLNWACIPTGPMWA